MLPLREYESMRETLYLMRNPANQRRLSESIYHLRAGRGQVHDLADDE